MEWLFLKGIITGLILSIPFGPVGIYCMEKTLSENQKKGYLAALGMISVDVIYSMAVLLFLDNMHDFVYKYRFWFKLFIGVLLIILGSRKLYKDPKVKKISGDASGYIKNYFKTFFIALPNISSFITIWMTFIALKVYNNYSSTIDAPFVLLGVFSGGASLWFFITFFLSHWRKTIRDDIISKIIKIMGAVILGFGIFMFLAAIKDLLSL